VQAKYKNLVALGRRFQGSREYILDMNNISLFIFPLGFFSHLHAPIFEALAFCKSANPARKTPK
jgi:hypothetical protein